MFHCFDCPSGVSSGKSARIHKRNTFGSGSFRRDVVPARSTGSHVSKSSAERLPATANFSHEHLLSTDAKSISSPTDFSADIVAASSSSVKKNNDQPASSGRKSYSDSPSASPRFIEPRQHALLDVSSPDQLAGQLFFFDSSLSLTAEELTRAPAEILGRSSHGTLYKATLKNGIY